MANCVTSPRIIWKIENFSSVCKKLCPATICIGGLKWQLIFSYYMEGGSEKNRLLLECLSSPQTLRACYFNVSVCIFDPNGKHSTQINAIYKLKCKELCIWSDTVSNFNEINGQINDVTFLITVTPLGNIKDLFNNEESVKEGNNEPDCVKSLIEDFGKLFNSDETSDFVLICNGKSFYVHKSVLSCRSDFFAAMFRSNMKEANEGIGQIPDIEPDILKLVLCYLYTGKIPELPVESIKKIYAAADRFAVESLKVKCQSLFVDDFIIDSEEDPEEDSAEVSVEDTENKPSGTVDGETEVVKIESREEKENRHLKELFMTREWRSFCREFPEKAQEMCKQYLLQK